MKCSNVDLFLSSHPHTYTQTYSHTYTLPQHTHTAAYASPHNTLMNVLMQSLLLDWLSEDLYDATISELDITVSSYRCGLVIGVCVCMCV
jgi:hypothetical protein